MESPGGPAPLLMAHASLCLRNAMLLSSRAGQGTWDLLATKE